MFDYRLFDYLHQQHQNYPLDKAFGQKVNAEWQYLSTDEILEQNPRHGK